MPETAYRLSIAPQLEPFRSEIEYACGFLDASYPVIRANDASCVLHYGDGAPKGAIVVPAILFPAGVRVDAGGLHPQRQALARMVGSGLLPARPSTIDDANFSYDAIGLIFFLLSRVEERDHPARDRYQRFSVDVALIAPREGRLHPWADEAARHLAAAIGGNPRPSPRTRYGVKFTHDVDMLKGYHRPLEPLRNAVGDVVKRFQPKSAFKRLYHAYFRHEPWTSARRLMALSERHRLTSHFYFMGPSENRMDSPYTIRLPDLVRSLAGEMRRRGHVIGFHPGFQTATDPVEWKRQRVGLERVIDAEVREGRQHVLRYDAAITPRIWSEEGMALNCTLAYPEVVGFRSGTCRPHQAYDLLARRPLPLQLHSTAVMEFGLFGGKYRDLTMEQAIAESQWAIDLCRQFGGLLGLLFHTGHTDARLWAWLEAVLKRAA